MKRQVHQGRPRTRPAPPDDNPLILSFAARLHDWRARVRRGLKVVAADLGVSISIVSEWENGRRFPNADHLYAVSRYTGIPAWRFLHPGRGRRRGSSARR